MTTTCRWGIMATGWIADLFANDLNLTGLPVTAVGSRSKASAQDFAQRHRIARAHDSYEALVADPDVDAIYVATPHPFHLAGARLALEAGKHVLIEKPFTINAREAHEIVAMAEARDLLVLEAMWTRFLPHMVRIREILAAGTLGTIRSLEADHSQALSDDPAHRINAMELGGGALLDLGIYPVSFACDVLGMPDSVHALARFKETGADAEVGIIMRHEGDVLSRLHCVSDVEGPNTARITGSKAMIEIDPVWYTPTGFRVVTHAGEVVEEFAPAPISGRGMQFQAIAMQEALAAGKRTVDLLPAGESVRIMEVMDRIRAGIGLRYAADARG